MCSKTIFTAPNYFNRLEHSFHFHVLQMFTGLQFSYSQFRHLDGNYSPIYLEKVGLWETALELRNTFLLLNNREEKKAQYDSHGRFPFIY